MVNKIAYLRIRTLCKFIAIKLPTFFPVIVFIYDLTLAHRDFFQCIELKMVRKLRMSFAVEVILVSVVVIKCVNKIAYLLRRKSFTES